MRREARPPPYVNSSEDLSAETHTTSKEVEQREEIHRTPGKLCNERLSLTARRTHRLSSDRHNSWSAGVTTARILLIDDDVELLDMLEAYLEREELVVTVANAAATGMAAALSGQHDLVVLDVMMPHMSGMEVLRKIRMLSLIPVLMLTAKGDDADCIIGLELGADDYVPKPCTPRELVARIRAILRRTRAVDGVEEAPAVIASGLLRVLPRQRRAEWAGKSLNLTSTEFNLLEALARHAGRPVNKNALSELALGRRRARFDRSIDVHVSSIRRQLGTTPDGRSWIQTVVRQGYQLLEQ
jgi:two-component system OmpR family response regulator/two-component system response regulator CpxR